MLPYNLRVRAAHRQILERADSLFGEIARNPGNYKIQEIEEILDSEKSWVSRKWRVSAQAVDDYEKLQYIDFNNRWQEADNVVAVTDWFAGPGSSFTLVTSGGPHGC